MPIVVAPGCYASAEAIHEELEYQKLTRCVYKIFAHPATKVRAFLESERQRHIQQGTQPGINVANAFTEMVKLSMILRCPSFDNAAIDHIKAVVARAKNDSAEQNRIAELVYSKSRADRAVLTNEDTNNFLELWSQQGDRLAAARAQVILLIGCATGFRACGLTRHALAEKDAVAAIGHQQSVQLHYWEDIGLGQKQGSNGGTQDRNYARESLQADMKAQANASGFVKDFRELHYLGRADIYVPEAWHSEALLPGLPVLLDAVLDLPYGKHFENCFFSKQLDGVKKVMATDEYGIFATDVREAELDSMEKLGLKVPYLKKWAQEQATLNYAAKGSTAEPDKPATKRLRLGSVWKEWLSGGDHASVMSLLHEGKKWQTRSMRKR
ncbi:hypothetical protein WJX77_009340 [Trebouxia sp. C0004]